jgi:hypothetical protein
MGRAEGNSSKADAPFPLVERQKTEIVLVDTGDWQGIYVDGELYTEGAQVRVNAVVTELGHRRSEMSVRELYADEAWWENEAHGTLPENLDDVVADDDD